MEQEAMNTKGGDDKVQRDGSYLKKQMSWSKAQRKQHSFATLFLSVDYCIPAILQPCICQPKESANSQQTCKFCDLPAHISTSVRI